MSELLPAGLEAAAILRRTEATGGYGTVIQKGDADRGSLLLLISSRGKHVTCLERLLGVSGSYEWKTVGPEESASSAQITEFLARRKRFDEDFWAIELDIPDAERFIAETTSAP